MKPLRLLDNRWICFLILCSFISSLSSLIVDRLFFSFSRCSLLRLVLVSLLIISLYLLRSASRSNYYRPEWYCPFSLLFSLYSSKMVFFTSSFLAFSMVVILGSEPSSFFCRKLTVKAFLLTILSIYSFEKDLEESLLRCLSCFLNLELFNFLRLSNWSLMEALVFIYEQAFSLCYFFWRFDRKMGSIV